MEKTVWLAEPCDTIAVEELESAFDSFVRPIQVNIPRIYFEKNSPTIRMAQSSPRNCEIRVLSYGTLIHLYSQS